jgi:hypothetical protein
MAFRCDLPLDLHLQNLQDHACCHLCIYTILNLAKPLDNGLLIQEKLHSEKTLIVESKAQT